MWRGCSMHAGRGPGRRARGGFRLCSASSGSFWVTRLTAGGLRRREPARTRAHQPCRLEGQTPALPPRESAACRRARTGRYTPVVVTFRTWFRKLERFFGSQGRKADEPRASRRAFGRCVRCHCTGIFWQCCTRAWRCKEMRRLQASRRRGVRDGVPRGCRYARAACAGPLPRARPMSHSSPECLQHCVVRPVERP